MKVLSLTHTFAVHVSCGLPRRHNYLLENSGLNLAAQPLPGVEGARSLEPPLALCAPATPVTCRSPHMMDRASHLL